MHNADSTKPKWDFEVNLGFVDCATSFNIKAQSLTLIECR